MSLARTERIAMAAQFLHLGPDVPTLCEGWNSADLLHHLLIRERRPDAAVGILLKPLSFWTERVTQGFAAMPWPELVRLLRTGPPLWNPMGWGRMQELTNNAEMLIHHEDLRRGQPDWSPRTLAPEDRRQVTALLSSPVTRMGLGRSGPGVIARVTDDPGHPDHTVVLRRGDPGVTVIGGGVEIVLWATGRRAVQVEFDGDPVAVEQVHGPGRGR